VADPAAKLHIQTAAAPTDIYLTDGTLGTDNYGGVIRGFSTAGQGGRLQLGTLDNDVYYPAVTILEQGGNVGIGTDSPAHLLDATVASGSASARIGTTHNTGSNDGTLIIGNGGSGDAMLRFDYEGVYTDRARIGVTSSGQQLEFYTAGENERMRITSGGDCQWYDTSAVVKMTWDASASALGIGVEVPSHILSVEGSSGTRTISGTTVNINTRLRPNGQGGLEIGSTTSDVYLHSMVDGGDMVFSTRSGSADYARMTIDSDGRIHVNKYLQYLQTDGSTVAGYVGNANAVSGRTTSDFAISSAASGSSIEFQTDGAATPKMVLTSGGDILTSTANARIGAASGYAVEYGTVSANSVFFHSADTLRMKIGGSGDCQWYEDTGTTPKMTWDASESRLGIGVTEPGTLLELAGSGSDLLTVNSTSSYTGILFEENGTSRFALRTNDGTSGLKFYDTGASAERMRITSGGTVALTEVAAAETSVGGRGQIWVKSDAPNTLWFTDDLGNDKQLDTAEIGIAVSDETTALTTGDAKATLLVPRNMTITEVKASLTGADTGAYNLEVDVRYNATAGSAGTTIFSADLEITAGDYYATKTGATAFVGSTSSKAVAENGALYIDINDSSMSAIFDCTGLKVWLLGYWN